MGADAGRQGADAERFGIGGEGSAVDVERLSADADRLGTGGEPSAADAERLSADAERIGTDAQRPKVDAERLGADAVLLGFVRVLRVAGVDASTERLYAFLRAVAALRPGVRTDVYWAGRATLCGGHDDLERYERVFAAYFGPSPEGTARPARAAPPPRPRLVARAARMGAGTPGEDESSGPPVAALASSAEVLRHRDVATLEGAERDQLRRLLAAFALQGQARRAARRRPARRSEVDPRRTVQIGRAHV